MEIKIRRIIARLEEIFQKLIDISDMDKQSEEKKKTTYWTRALAATAIRMRGGNEIPPQILAEAVTDGYHDMGIDAIYLDRNQKKLFLVQSKLRQDAQGGIDTAEISSFRDGIKRIMDLELQGANEKISKKEKDIELPISDTGYQICAIFIHTGNQKANEYILRPINELLSTVNDSDNTLLTFEEIECNSVYSYLANEQNSQSIDIDDVVLFNWGKQKEPFPVYYGTISAAAIGDWVKKYDNAIFAKNIRYYKGDTEVNKGIVNVLIKEPENFLYYNNGIKILCNKVEKKALHATNNDIGMFVLSEVSIVNGAQTAGSIAEASLLNNEQVEKAKVFIQIIDLSEAPQEMSLTITRLSNTQNRIDGKDFISQDPNQERIRQELLFSHIEYLYKSGDLIKDPSKQICFEEAIVAKACLNQELSLSVLAKRNIGGLYESITKPPYAHLFNSGTNSFEVYNSVIITRIIENALHAEKEKRTGRERLIIVHCNRFVTFCVLQKIKGRISLDKNCLIPQNIREDIGKETNNILTLIFDILKVDFLDSYPANIFKNVTKCRAIYEKIENKKAIESGQGEKTNA